MFLSNRAIFQRNALSQGAPSLNETFTISSSLDHAFNLLQYDSLKLQGFNTSQNDEYIGAYNFNRWVDADPGSLYPTRPSTAAKVAYSMSLYVSQDWLDDHTVVAQYEYDNFGQTLPQVHLFSHNYNQVGFWGLGMNPVADIAGIATNGRLHVGRTQSEPGYQYDGYFVIDFIGPDGEGKFKFPFNRSEIVDQWVTITFAFSPNTTDFDNWSGWDPNPSNPSYQFCRFYMTTKSGTVTMDINNRNMFALGDPVTVWPNLNAPFNTGEDGHAIKIGDPQYFRYYSQFGPNTKDIRMSNIWFTEGTMFDPKFYHADFTYDGKPQKVTSAIAGASAMTYISCETQAATRRSNGAMRLPCSVTNTVYDSEFITSTGVAVSEIYAGNPYPAMPIQVSGGTVTTSGGYRIHTFNSTGNLSVTGTGNIAIEYLVVGGGGAGDRDSGSGGGGGGGGGVLTGNTAISSGTYTITVGLGGTTPLGQNPQSGGNSSIGNLVVALGGDGGGNGGTGGSGGGASSNGTAAGSGTAGQGNNGGTAQTNYGGGGGGGRNAVGQNAYSSAGTYYGGNGGAGLTSNITGANVVYGSGGGGGINSALAQTVAGTGGSGAGAGGRGTTGGNGTTNRGGGGGGGGSSGGTTNNGGNGGSGVVIIRYPI